MSDTPLTDARWRESVTANAMSDYTGIAYGHNWPQIAEEVKYHAERLERKLSLISAERDEARDLLFDCWFQWSIETHKGCRIDGGLSTLEDVCQLLRECGRLDEKGNSNISAAGAAK